MSAKSKSIEWLFRIARVSEKKSPKTFYRKLRKNAIRYKRGERIPRRVSGVRVEKNLYCGMQYFTFIPKHVESAASVLYIHGSGYVNAHTRAHEKLAAEIASSVHAKVYFPIYPKLPICTAVSCQAVLYNFYRFLLKQQKIFLVGDSSGASLCLVLSEGERTADRLILISPWLDATLANVGEDEQKKDVFLNADRLRRTAKLWAYDLPLTDSKISPAQGNYEGKEIVIFCGENEIFKSSIQAFCVANRKNKTIRITYVEGKDQPHDYPLFSTPEGQEARKMLSETLVRFLYDSSSAGRAEKEWVR